MFRILRKELESVLSSVSYGVKDTNIDLIIGVRGQHARSELCTPLRQG